MSLIFKIVLTILLGGVLLGISLEDVKKHKIRDGWILLLLFMGLCSAFVFPETRPAARIAGMFVVSVPMLACALIRRGTVGGGDIKLVAAGGFLLGTEGILWASFIGLLASLLTEAMKGRKEEALRKRKIPLGPFLSLGIFLIWGLKYTIK